MGALVLVVVIAAMFGVGVAVFLRGKNRESGYCTSTFTLTYLYCTTYSNLVVLLGTVAKNYVSIFVI